MKKVTRLSSLILAFLLCLTMLFTGCGTQQTETSSGSQNDSSAAATSTAAAKPDYMAPFAPYPETVILTTARVENKGQAFAAGESSSDNGMLRLIEKKLNVKFNIKWEAPSDQYMSKLSLNIASNDLPDVFQVVGENAGIVYRSLVSNGALADLTEAYEKCLGGMAKDILAPIDPKEYLCNLYYNDKLYGIAPPADIEFFNLMWIRNDWLKKLGLEVPKTIEDIEKVAKQFVEKDPGGTGNPVGIAMNPEHPINKSNNYYSLTPIANSLGSFPNTWLKGSDGKITYGSIAPETREALAILARWYKQGILDKSFVTLRNNDDVTPMVNNSQIGILFAAWWESWIFADMVSKTPGAEWIPVLAPLNKDGKFAHTNTLNNGVNGATCVSAKCKNPEAVIKAMNVEFDAINGAYDDNPDDFALFKAAKEANSLGRTISPFGIGRIAGNFSRVPTFVKSINDYIKTGQVTYNAFNLADKDYIEGAYRYNQKPDPKDANGVIGYYGHYLAGNLTQLPENQNVDEVVVDVTDSMADLWPALDAMQRQYFVQIITGEKPVDAFDEFVAKWKSTGGDIITAEVNEAYK